jgi:hypothetical protein
MAVIVEMHHTGDPVLRADVVAVIEHVLSDRPGDWRVSIVGSQAKILRDAWVAHDAHYPGVDVGTAGPMLESVDLANPKSSEQLTHGWWRKPHWVSASMNNLG